MIRSLLANSEWDFYFMEKHFKKRLTNPMDYYIIGSSKKERASAGRMMVITMTRKAIEEMKNNMMEAGVYSIKDIEEICRLESEYTQECEEIAVQCVEEGYPSNGSNYDLRCEAARRYYDEQIALIDSMYEEDERD